MANSLGEFCNGVPSALFGLRCARGAFLHSFNPILYINGVSVCSSAASVAMASYTENSNRRDSEERDFQALPEVPDDGVLIKTLYVGVCHATHSPLRTLDVTNFVGE